MSFFPKEIASSASGIFLLEEALQFSLEETVLSRLGAAKSDPFQKSKSMVSTSLGRAWAHTSPPSKKTANSLVASLASASACTSQRCFEIALSLARVTAQRC